MVARGLAEVATVEVAGDVESDDEAERFELRTANFGTKVHLLAEMVVMELNDDIAEGRDRQPSCQAQRTRYMVVADHCCEVDQYVG